ncbi:MAG: hypothetical protein PHQ27_07260, partial [Victivallales bacterium]|nr:hypothetical protein [Victivallales bacterium]
MFGSWEMLEGDEVPERVTAMLDQLPDCPDQGWKLKLQAGLLMQAAQFYATGSGKTADDMATSILAGNDVGKMLRLALALMARARYDEIFLDFIRSGDWCRYHDDLTQMLQHYGGYWPEAPGGEVLRHLLQDRIAGRVAPLPGRPFPLTPQDR